MANKALSRAEKEYIFLKQSAIAMMALGLFFIADLSYKAFASWGFMGIIITGFTLFVGLLAFVILILSLIKTLRNVPSHAGQLFFLRGEYTDEWLARLNLNGYRNCSIVLLGALVLSMMDHPMIAEKGISSYAQGLFSIALISYSAPILWGVFQNNE